MSRIIINNASRQPGQCAINAKDMNWAYDLSCKMIGPAKAYYGNTFLDVSSDMDDSPKTVTCAFGRDVKTTCSHPFLYSGYDGNKLIIFYTQGTKYYLKVINSINGNENLNDGWSFSFDAVTPFQQFYGMAMTCYTNHSLLVVKTMYNLDLYGVGAWEDAFTLTWGADKIISCTHGAHNYSVPTTATPKPIVGRVGWGAGCPDYSGSVGDGAGYFLMKEL